MSNMIEFSPKNEVTKRRLQLNALLEITQAINSNLSESSLYKIFNFTLRSNLHITRLALFTAAKDWSCLLCFGTKPRFINTKLPDRYKKLKTIYRPTSSNNELFPTFDLMIPFIHKRQTLALVCIGRSDEDPLDEESIKFIQTLSNITLVAIENKKLIRQQLQQEIFRKELEIAGNMQHLLFPKKLPCSNTLKIEASYLPHDHVGGDYYDYIPLEENRFFICVADVSGKGIAAALMMSNFQATLKALIRQTVELDRFVELLNQRVLESALGERIVTFFCAIYDGNKKVMSYVNAGHNPPLLYAKGHAMQLLEKGCPVLGAIHPLPFVHAEQISDLDDFFFFAYTDGLTETINEQEKPFGLRPLIEYLDEHYQDKPLKMIHQDVIVMLDHFKGKNRYPDDITLLSCCVAPS